jgi:(p)ppGpp synthase/HD superfamily hydrolase
MTLSPRFDQALHYTALVHAGQSRTGTGAPYMAHLLGVASLTLEYGGNEDEAIAALLHDAVEDAGGAPRMADIRLRFGPVVADIVAGCTDSDATPKPPWRERKENYLARLPRKTAGARLVSAADKLYNVRAILHHYRRDGEAVWSRFCGERSGILWYYRTLVTAFRQTNTHRELVDELDRVVSELETLSAANTANLA